MKTRSQWGQKNKSFWERRLEQIIEQGPEAECIKKKKNPGADWYRRAEEENQVMITGKDQGLKQKNGTNLDSRPGANGTEVQELTGTKDLIN